MLVVKKTVIICCLFILTSCSLSTFQKNMVGFYKENDILKTYDKIVIDKNIAKYKYNLFGVLRIYYNDKLISQNCHFGFDNGNGTDGHLLSEDGRYIVNSNQSTVYLRKLYCVVSDDNPRFKYLFQKKEIELSVGNNVLNNIELFFSEDKEGKDTCSVLQDNDVNLTNFIVKDEYFKPSNLEVKRINRIKSSFCP